MFDLVLGGLDIEDISFKKHKLLVCALAAWNRETYFRFENLNRKQWWSITIICNSSVHGAGGGANPPERSHPPKWNPGYASLNLVY